MLNKNHLLNHIDARCLVSRVSLNSLKITARIEKLPRHILCWILSCSLSRWRIFVGVCSREHETRHREIADHKFCN